MQLKKCIARRKNRNLKIMYDLIYKHFVKLNAKLDQLIKMWLLYIEWCKKFDEIFDRLSKK